MPRADVAQREDLPGLAVEQVDLLGRDAVSAENLSQRLARTHFARFETVGVGVDAVDEVLGCGLFRFRFGLGRIGPAAGSRGPQQQEAYRDFQDFHSMCKIRKKTEDREF